LSQFRLPDNELLKIGSPFSKREFEILKIIANGYSAGQIAQELFLSVNTVNTHRGNILNKSGHKRIQELVAEIKEKGVI
jgi:DNA-binding CsgD family transcriptional regulator